jgi:hypothetical protein
LDLEAAAAHQIDQRRRFAFEALLPPIDDEAADRRVRLDGDLRILDPPRPHHLKAEVLDRRDDLQEPRPFEILGIEDRSAHQKREPPEEIHPPTPFLARLPSPSNEPALGRPARDLPPPNVLVP